MQRDRETSTRHLLAFKHTPTCEALFPGSDVGAHLRLSSFRVAAGTHVTLAELSSWSAGIDWPSSFLACASMQLEALYFCVLARLELDWSDKNARKLALCVKLGEGQFYTMNSRD